MKKIAVLIFTSLFFFSCEWFHADLIAYLDYYTNTALIDRHELDGSYPVVGGITQIPSGSSRKIQFVMINPQQYSLNGTLSWNNDPLGGVPVEYGKHYTLEQIQYNIFELTFTNEFLTTVDSNPALGNISGTIGINEKETGRAFESYSYTLSVNSPPAAVLNAQFSKATTNGRETWWLSFNVPEKTGINSDIKEITIDGTVYDYADTRFITTAPTGLKDSLGNNVVLVGSTQRYVDTGLASNIEANRTITVSDSRGLSTAITINTGDIPIVISPTIHVDGIFDAATGTKTVSISSTIDGATIYYTLDGSIPTTSSALYNAPFSINLKDSNVTVKAMAVNTGMKDSSVAIQEFLQVPQVSAPSITASEADGLGNKTVTIGTTTAGATIYYTTDGSEPATIAGGSTHQYIGTVFDVAPPTLIKAIAVKADMIHSLVASYNIGAAGTVDTPLFSPIHGSTVIGGTPLVITSANSEKIYYTTGVNNVFDSKNPTANNWKLYDSTAAIEFLSGIVATYRAIATKDGLINSSIASATYTQEKVVMPSITISEPDGRGYRTVTISTVPTDATLYYTTDGSNPNMSSSQYTNPFSVDVNTSTVTVKALAIKAGMVDSDVTEKIVPRANAVNTPVFDSPYSVPSGTELALSTTTPGATIYYTTGGSDFSAGDWLVYSDSSKPTINFTAGVTSVTYRAIATGTNLADSPVATQIYTQAEITNSSITDDDIEPSIENATASGIWKISSGSFTSSNSVITIHAGASLSIPGIEAALQNAISIPNTSVSVAFTTGTAGLGQKTFTATLTATNGYIFPGGSQTKNIPITFTVKQVIATSAIDDSDGNIKPSAVGGVSFDTGTWNIVDGAFVASETTPFVTMSSTYSISQITDGIKNLISVPNTTTTSITSSGSAPGSVPLSILLTANENYVFDSFGTKTKTIPMNITFKYLVDINDDDIAPNNSSTMHYIGTWSIANARFEGSESASSINAIDSVTITDIATALENAITINNASVAVTHKSGSIPGVVTMTATLTPDENYVVDKEPIDITFTVKQVISGDIRTEEVNASPTVANAGLSAFTIDNFETVSDFTATFAYNDITETQRITAIVAAVNSAIGAVSSLPTGATWANIDEGDVEVFGTQARITFSFGSTGNYVFSIEGATDKGLVFTVSDTFISSQATYYVAETGADDNYAGTEAYPFASVQRAVDVIKAIREGNATTISISGIITNKGSVTGTYDMVAISGGNDTLNITLLGASAGATINAGAQFTSAGVIEEEGLGRRVLLVGGAKTTVTLGVNLTLTGGYPKRFNSDYDGGGVYVNGGIFNMSGGTISGNISGTAEESFGGGVYVSYNGTFTMSGGTISGNYAYNGGGVSVYGGNSYKNTTFTMEDGLIDGNYAQQGGGVHVGGGGTFTMKDGTINVNNATGSGGGVYVNSADYSSGEFTMSGGTISKNSGPSGGGVYVVGYDSVSHGNFVAKFNMSGGTISENTATSLNWAEGGGVHVNSFGKFTMSGGTISKNTVTDSRTSYGGGVFVGEYSEGFYVSGNPNITGNTKVPSSNSNVYFTNDTASSGVKINGALTSDASIGLSPSNETDGFVVVQGAIPAGGVTAHTITLTDLSKLTLDDTSLTVGFVINSNNIILSNL